MTNSPASKSRLAARARWVLAALAAALGALALSPAPAAALSQRGHSLAGPFQTSGEGVLSDPGGLAASAATGDVYVLDRGHNRIVQYTPTGQFISAWGYGVHGAKSFWQACTTGCTEAAARNGFLLSDAQSIAVDNCTHEGRPCTTAQDPSVGDVYIAAPREHEEELYEVLEKFSPEGRLLERTTKIPYSEAGETEKLEEPEAAEAHGLTVGPEGTPWLYYEETLYPLNDIDLKKPAGRPPLELSLSGEPAAGLAVDSHGDFYLAQQSLGLSGTPLVGASEWAPIPGSSELQEVSAALDGQDTTALAVNPLDTPEHLLDEQDDVYLTNTISEHAATTASLAQFDPEGHLVQRLSLPGFTEPAAVALDPATGTVYVTDAATSKVDRFTLEEPGPPTPGPLTVREVAPESALLEGQLDPQGAATSYAFRYSTGPLPGAGEPCTAPCVQVPQTEQEAGSGFAEHAVTAQLGAGASTPLQPATSYHYRLTATNEHGASQSAEGSLSTPPTTARDLADDRVWEIVSPAAKAGAEVEPISEVGGLIAAAAAGDAATYVTNIPIGSPEGTRAYEPSQILSCSTRLPSCAATAHGHAGWVSQDIVTANSHGAGTGPSGSNPPEYVQFSSDLSLAAVYPWRSSNFGTEAEVNDLAEPPLSPPLTTAEEQHGQEKTVYLRADAPLQPQGEPESGLYRQAAANGVRMQELAAAKAKQLSSPGFLALVSDENVFAGTEFGGQNGVKYLEGTPDLSHVVLESLISASPCESPLLGCATGLYEWSPDGSIEPVSVLPCKSDPCAPAEQLPVAGVLGQEERDLRHAVSDDGSLVFWTREGHLYARDMPAHQTIQLDQPQGGSGDGTPRATFQDASAEGSTVFFTDEQALTPTAGARTGRPDLYACQISDTEGTPACTLSDLTSPLDPSAPEAADVQGFVLGASEDASYVYFAADGVLTQAEGPEGAHAASGDCARGDAIAWSEAQEQHTRPAGHTCNLYLTRHTQTGGWVTSFIAPVSEEDAVNWEAGQAESPAELSDMTSRVSPDGRRLAFMSSRPLTSYRGQRYDNRATSPAADGQETEEVYEYTAPAEGGGPGEAGEAGALTCVSCDPSGARPVGVLDPFQSSVEAGGEALLVDRTLAWSGRWLSGVIPTYTRLAVRAAPYALYQSRYLADSGRLYFDSPEDLLAQATNRTEDVYEYEPAGVPQGAHQCTTGRATYSPRAQGCVGLISSGTAKEEAAFVDASETGGEGTGAEELSEGGADVFFVSSAELVPEDTEPTFSLFDAHECTTASPCIVPAQEKPLPACETTEACRAPAGPAAPLGSPATAAAGAPGNITPRHDTLPEKTTGKPKPKPGPLTRAQKLARALKACRARLRTRRAQRQACERQARRRYGPQHPKNGTRRAGHARAADRRRIGGGR